MTAPHSTPLNQRSCKACEGGVDKLTVDESTRLLADISPWTLSDSGDEIERTWKFANFVQAMDFLHRVTELAEREQHHPDFHLTGYRHVRIVLTTHAILGLSENDFIVAAKINAIVP